MNKLKILSIITLILMILPPAGLFAGATVANAATPSIETSADVAGGYFTDGVFVWIKITDTARAGAGTIAVNVYKNNVLVGSMTFYEVGNSGTFMAYIVNDDTANPDSDVDVTPFGNDLGQAATQVYDLDDEWPAAAGLGLVAGDELKFEYVGADGTVSATLTYDTFDETISADRTDVPAFSNAKIYFTVVEQDKNYDPSAADTFNINVNVEAIDKLGTSYAGPAAVTITLTETGPNTATFTGVKTVDDLLTAVGLNTYTATTDVAGTGFQVVNFGAIDNAGVPFDHLKVSVASGNYVDLNLVTTEGTLQEPSSGATITLASELEMTLNDQDMNLDTKAKDTVNIQVDIAGVGTIKVTLTETDVNTGIFKGTATLTYGTPAAANDATDTFTLDKPYTLTITYKDPSVNVNTVVLDVDMTSTPAELSIDKTEALPIESVTLTLVDPDLNDNGNDTSDSFGHSFAAGNNLNWDFGPGQFKVYVNGALDTAASNFFLFFEEVEPGIFQATFNLQWLSTALADGDVVKFEWIDDYDSAAAGTTVSTSVEVTIIKPPVSVSLDRDTYPLPDNGVFTVYVTVDNPYLNTQAGVAETIAAANYQVQVILWNGATYNVPGLPNLVETGVDTGVFEAAVPVNLGAILPAGTPLEQATGATVKVTYTYGGNNYEDTATIQPHTAVLTINGTSSITANMGDYVTITLVEPDLNTDSRAVDAVPAASLTQTGLTAVPALTETGPNTGVFTGTFRIGVDAPFAALTPTDTFTVTYTDQYTAMTSPTAQRTGTSEISGSVAAHTAEFWVGDADGNPVSEIGPFTTVFVYYKDPDRVLDWEAGAAIAAQLYIRGSHYYTAAAAYEEEDQASLGNFAPVTDMPNTFRVAVPVAKVTAASAAYDGTLDVDVPDTIVVRVVDPVDASGNAKSLIQWLSVNAWDGQISIVPDKAYYDDGDDIEIWVYDPDANTNPTTQQTVFVQITSWRYVDGELQVVDPVGVNVQLFENGTDSAWFKGMFTIDSTNPPPFFEVGDVLKVSYEDQIASDGETKVTSTKELQIGYTTETPVTPPAPEDVTFKATDGTPLTPKAGTPMLIDVPVSNADTMRTVTVDIVLLVYTPDGVPVDISYGRITLNPGESTTAMIGWLPKESGDFHIKIFFWDLAEKKPLSQEPLELDVTVE